MTIETIIFYLIFLDAVCANLLVLFGSDWYAKHFRTISRWFPPGEGWALYYLILVLWVGSFLYRAKVLFWQ